VKWLEDFDNELDRSIVLILDLSTWSLLQPNPEDHGEQNLLPALSARLMNIVISKVPKAHDAFHPMAAGLGQEFKLLYLCFLLGLDVDVDKHATPREETTFVDRLSFIRDAWFSVRESTINQSFKTVEVSLRNWAGQHRSLESSIWNKSSKVLPLSRGMVIDEDPRRHPLPRDRTNLIDNDLSREIRNAFPSAPDTVIQYYLTQEAEVGPSSFLRNKVREMQRDKDFEGCFRSSDLAQVRYLEALAHPIHGKAQLGGGDNATGLDKNDMLTLDIAPYLSESFDTSQSNLNPQESAQIGNTVAHHNPLSIDNHGPHRTPPSPVNDLGSNIIYREWGDELDTRAALICSEVRYKIPTKKLRALKRVNVCTDWQVIF